MMFSPKHLLIVATAFCALLPCSDAQCSCPNMDTTSDGLDPPPAGQMEFAPDMDYSPDGCSLSATCSGMGPLLECVWLEGDGFEQGQCAPIGNEPDPSQVSSTVDFTCTDGAWELDLFPGQPIYQNVYCDASIVTTTSTTTSTTTTTTTASTTSGIHVIRPDPPPRMSGNARVVPVTLVRNKSVDDFNEQIVNMLDEVERRVEQLREAAGLLEQERECIIDTLSNFSLNTELLRLGQGDREDINATANRLMSRTKAVEVVVNTPRNEEQQKALTNINALIDGVTQKMTDDLLNSKETCRRYLNACSPDQPEGPIDQRFQANVIECTADDQKKIRRKLAQIITQIERAERTCKPQW